MFFCPAHEVLHDEEVVCEPHLFNDAEFVFQALMYGRRRIFIPRRQALQNDFTQVCNRRFAVRSFKDGNFRLAELYRHIARIFDAFGVLNRFGIFRKMFRHLFRRLQVDVKIFHGHAVGVVNRAPCLHGKQYFVRILIVFQHVMHVVGGDYGDAVLLGERGKPCVKFLRVRLELYIVVFAEYALVARDDVGSRVHFSGRNCPRKFSGKASREADNAFGMPREESIINARLVVEPLKVRGGYDFQKIFPTGVVFCKQSQVVAKAVFGTFHCHAARRNVYLNAQNGLHVPRSGFFIKLYGSVQVSVVG